MNAERPRLLFFRWTRSGLPAFLQAQVDEQVTTLARCFDVHVVSTSGDYDEFCDTYQPDMCLFESGVYASDRALTRTDTHPEIPKLGFLHADAFDSSRAAFLSDMAEWGVDSFVTTSMSMPEYLPEIANRLFVWPNSVDGAIFRDYGEEKTVDVLLTGSRAPHYPWRNEVSRALALEYRTRSMPHFGWNSQAATASMVQGEAYARLINASLFVPTCGTMARDVVRKHLEIPAAHSCLITERTESIEALGFEDLVNCVFADEYDVVDKVSMLLRDQGLLATITEAGYNLVHERHTTAHRDQIAQWYRLVSEFGTGIEVDQTWPTGSLSVSTTRGTAERRIHSGGRDRLLLAEGWQATLDGEPDQGLRLFRQAADFFLIPEAQIAIAHGALLVGDVDAAQEALSRMHIAILGHHKAATPDPVEWAYEIRLQLCRNNDAMALAAALQYPGLRDGELDRMRRAVATITGVPVAVDEVSPRASAMPVPDQSDSEWTGQLVTMLRSAGRPDAAERLTGLVRVPAVGPGRIARAIGSRRLDHRMKLLASGNLKSLPIRWTRARLAPMKRRLTRDPWADFVKQLAQSEVVDRVVVITPVGDTRILDALREGAAENPARPLFFVVDPATRMPEEPLLVNERSLVVVPAGVEPSASESFLAGAAVVVAQDSGSPFVHSLTTIRESHVRAAGPQGGAILRRRTESPAHSHDPVADLAKEPTL